MVTNIRKAGILYHPLKVAARDLARELGDWLRAKGIATWESSAWEQERARAQINGTDLILTTGGDGTILHAVQVAVLTGTPVLGINLGKLGFMTELSAEEAKSALPSILGDKGWIDERYMVEAEVLQSQGRQQFIALNDVVAARGAVARMITVDVSVNNEKLAAYRADGVIVATATGSTGYALAAGGPILYPQSADMVLQPISPHLCACYSIVLPPGAVVGLNVGTMHQATLSIDGIINQPLENGASITIRQSRTKARFLRLRPERFYGELEQKLERKQGIGTGTKSQNY